MESSTEQNAIVKAAEAISQAPKKSEEPGTGRQQKPPVASAKGKSGKKTSPTKKASRAEYGAKIPRIPKAVKRQKASARDGSKTAKVLDLLNRPDGATLKEIMKTTGWQPHSVRGFIAGTLGKRMGLKVGSAKREDGQRVYTLAK